MASPVSHEGHRQRLKNRFLQEGLENFEKHNVLEILLFYAIPQRDTNDIAHELLNTFGSLKGVFEADYTELLNVKGVKENTATLIKLIPEIAREYMFEEISEERVFDTAEKIGKYFVRKYIGEVNEVVYLMLLDNGFKLLDVCRIHEGSVNSANISPRKIMNQIIKYNASMAVVAHNHPNGVALPSMEDINTTYSLRRTLDSCEVDMVEHILVGGNEYFPIIHETANSLMKSEEHEKLFRKFDVTKDQ
jgi:DNA repair protein RadC